MDQEASGVQAIKSHYGGFAQDLQKSYETDDGRLGNLINDRNERKGRNERKKARRKEERKEGKKERRKEGKKERKKGTRSNNSAAATDGLWPAEAETLCYRIRVFDRAKLFI